MSPPHADEIRMGDFTASAVEGALSEQGLVMPDHVVPQLIAAIDAGKHVILTGPPGTGKTTMAYTAAEVARRAMLCTGFLPTTATTEWTTFETIGGLQPTPDGLIFRPGQFVEAIMAGQWLIIDELNRSNFDRAFGQLFTVLAGSPVVLPYKQAGQPHPVSIVPAGAAAPPETDPIRVPATWRIVATMNQVDKNLLFDMSYALMRRFAFIEVGTPSPAAYDHLLGNSVVRELLPVRELVDLGPAIFLDAASYAHRRAQDGVGRSRLLYEVFYAYFLPQFEGLNDDDALRLLRFVGNLFDPEEQAEARRTITAALGVEFVG